MNLSMVPGTYSVEEVAERLGISARWLADECRAGHIEHLHAARERRFTLDQVHALYQRLTVTPLDTQKLNAARSRVARRLARGT